MGVRGAGLGGDSCANNDCACDEVCVRVCVRMVLWVSGVRAWVGIPVLTSRLVYACLCLLECHF